MSTTLGPRRQRRREERRARFLVPGLIILVTVAVVAAILLWPRGREVPAPPDTRGVPVPEYVRSFGSDGADPLVEPVGIAVAGGRVYVADAARGEVVVYTSGGTRLAAFGRGRLAKPIYVAHNPLDGRIYVSDRIAPGIQVFDLAGEFVKTFVPDVSGGLNGSTREWRPFAVTFTDNGTMYLTDAAARQRILKIGPTGTLIADAGRFVPEGPAGTSVSYANGIAAASDRVVVADSNNQRLLLFDEDLHLDKEAAFDGLPRGVCVVSWGQRPIFAVADTTGGDVSLVDRDGVVQRTFDGAGTPGGPLSMPTDVAHDGKQSLYVVDGGNHRISLWRVTGYPKIAREPAEPPDTRLRLAASIALAGAAATLAALLLRSRAREAV